MERKLLNDVALGAFILAALGVLAYMSIAVGGLKIGKAIMVQAKFDNAAGLVKDSAIMIAGVHVGSVDGLTVAHNMALVKLRLSTDAHVRKDVHASIRMKSLLGEKYVELLPQSETAPLLADGDVITVTDVPVEIDTVMKRIGPALEDVDPKDVGIIVHAVARTLDGRGEKLGDTLDKTAAAIATLDRVLTRNEDTLSRMLTNLDRATTHAPELVARLDRMSADLEPGTRELGARGPVLLKRFDRLSQQLAPTTDQLAARGPGLVTKMEGTLDALSPGLTRLPKTLDTLQPSLDRLPRTLERLDRLVGKLEGTLNKIDPVLNQARDLQIFDTDGSVKVKARLF